MSYENPTPSEISAKAAMHAALDSCCGIDTLCGVCPDDSEGFRRAVDAARDVSREFRAAIRVKAEQNEKDSAVAQAQFMLRALFAADVTSPWVYLGVGALVSAAVVAGVYYVRGPRVVATPNQRRRRPRRLRLRAWQCVTTSSQAQ